MVKLYYTRRAPGKFPDLTLAAGSDALPEAERTIVIIDVDRRHRYPAFLSK
jgi:hypothetical protein